MLDKITTIDKIKTAFTGIDNPRPVNTITPLQPFETTNINTSKKIECWSIKNRNPKGTVVIFHGYMNNKSSGVARSDIFQSFGYNTFLVDFMGSGGSEGNQTTIGCKEAVQVKECFDYLKNQGEKNIILFGTSMGAVAILKAIRDYDISPAMIIIECPYGSLYKTICARFEILKLPSFPFAAILTFWGGIINGFWGYSIQPTEYAKNVHCPTMIIYGGKDGRVSRDEINKIYANLKCVKQLKVYPLAGHDNFLEQYREEWTKDIDVFLSLKSGLN